MPILNLAPKEVTDALKHHDDQDWLDQHPPGAPYTPPPPQKEKSNFNWWIVGGVGVVAFFVLVLVLMY